MDGRLKEVGGRIRRARCGRKLSQSELAERIQISPSHMSDIENGKTNIGLDIFMRLTETLQISADWLLRTDIPAVNDLQNKEITDLLADCSPREAEVILKIIKDLKDALHTVSFSE